MQSFGYSSLAAWLLMLLSAIDMAAASTCFDESTPKQLDPETWKFCQEIEPNLFLYYSPMEDDGNVLLGLHATKHTDGWSALALGGNGGMKGASQIVVRKDSESSGEWIAEDRHSDDYATPALDESQDVELLFADQTDEDGTFWGVLLTMNSCDADDYAIGNHSRWMHWALGESHDFAYHGDQRGQFHANLLAAAKEAPSTEGLESIDILMPNVPVVLGEGGQDPTNPYLCTFYHLAEVLPESVVNETKVHAVHMSPVLDDDSAAYVHHMLLYVCEIDDDDDVPFEHTGVQPECESMPRGCYAVKFAWAVGGQDIVLPENVGVPFSPKAWVALQMHYFNPNLDEGVMDSSGLRAFFTPEVRDIDAGFLELNGGTSPYDRSPLLPGRRDLAIDPLILPSDCTAQWSEPLNVLGVIHHLHLVGTNLRISIERNGAFAGTLRTEHHYDFNHQSFEESEVPMLEPGDKLSMQCVYDTSTRSDDTMFGDLSQQEMCYALLLYYPRQPEWESFGYFELPDEEVKACTTAGTGEFSEASLCAQVYVTNLPTFFGFGFDGDYGALEYCNGEAGSANFQRFAEFICPPCHSTNNCTATDVLGFAQFGVCPDECSELGVSVYPDTSQTETPLANGIWCGDGEDSFDGYVEAQDFAAEPACQAVGNLSKAADFQNSETTSGGVINYQHTTSLTMVCMIVCGIFLMELA